jgi:hypothetical protein
VKVDVDAAGGGVVVGGNGFERFDNDGFLGVWICWPSSSIDDRRDGDK